MFTDADAGRYLFHYTRQDAFLAHILPTRQLRMSSFANLNDPRESKNWQCSVRVPSSSPVTWDVVALSRQFSEEMKGRSFVVCFTRDDPDLNAGRLAHLYGRGYAHPSMWDRYAGGHSGVCLSFDAVQLGDDIARSVGSSGLLYHQGISYADMPPNAVEAFELDGQRILDNGEAAALREHQENYAGSLYFYKSTDWSTEFEYRWVLIADDSSSEHYINIAPSLSGVIFGDAFPRPAIEMVRPMLESTGVLTAQIRYRNGDPVVVPA